MQAGAGTGSSLHGRSRGGSVTSEQEVTVRTPTARARRFWLRALSTSRVTTRRDVSGGSGTGSTFGAGWHYTGNRQPDREANMAAIGESRVSQGSRRPRRRARSAGEATSPTRRAAGSRSPRPRSATSHLPMPRASYGSTKTWSRHPVREPWFFGEVLEGIERALLGASYDLTLTTCRAGAPSGLACSTSSWPASASTR